MSKPGNTVDWSAVRAHYEAGHTRTECQARFEFSNGAWNRAVQRGDVRPRPRSSGLRASAKREAVARLIAEGKSYSQISAELGLAKATVAYHARRAGVPVDEKASRRYDWAEVQAAYDSGLSVRGSAAKFGFCHASWNAAVKRGAIKPRPQVMPLEEFLVAGRTTNRVYLKNRLISANLKEDRCETCGLTEWHGAPISLHLHHVNGDGRDNRLENLQVLCPNCHSQTPNYGGRNGHRRPTLRLMSGEPSSGSESDVA
jgi:DNA-binding CsgD family transcriptional regulator/5-methylcytosine-specific restriction endonuclease McrA